MNKLKIINDAKCDQNIEEFVDLHSSASFTAKAQEFDITPRQRLDHFYMTNVKVDMKYPKCIFVMHNGQAEVERGFSENKAAISPNMGEITTKSRRMIKDHLRSHDQRHGRTA